MSDAVFIGIDVSRNTLEVGSTAQTGTYQPNQHRGPAESSVLLDVPRPRFGQNSKDDVVDGRIRRILLLDGAAQHHPLAGVVHGQEFPQERAQPFHFTSNFNGCHGP